MRWIKFVAADFVSGCDATFEGLPANAKLTPWETLRLAALFHRYVTAGGRGDKISPSRYFASHRGDALKVAYQQTFKGGRLVNLRAGLKRLAGNRCPSCGGSRPGQLDHHLPKTVYREFSLLPANLVACCGECNQTKRAIVGATAEEALLHPYFDAIPDVPFIRVTLDVHDRYIGAVLAFDDDVKIEDALLKTRMKHHFDSIDIASRLEPEVTELIGETGASIDRSDPNPAPETVRRILLEAAAAKVNYFGRACWQAAVLNALAESDAYCSGGFRATRTTGLAA